MGELEAVLGALLAVIAEGVILADSNGIILLANQAAQRLIGRPAHELVGRPLDSLHLGQPNAPYTAEALGHLDLASGRFTQSKQHVNGALEYKPAGRKPASASLLLLVLRAQRTQQQARQAQLADRRLAHLHEIGRAIRAARAPDAAAQAALRHIRRLVPCMQALVLGFDHEAAEAMVIALLPGGANGTAAGVRMPLGAIEAAHQLHRHQPYVVEDAAAQPPTHPLWPAGTRSFLSVPLVAGGRLIGTLDVAANTPNAFDLHHTAIVCEVADQLAIAFQNDQLVQQVQAHSERLRALSRQLMEIQENERHRIARELHDEIGQSLTAVKINIESSRRVPDQSTAKLYLDDSIAIIERLIQQVRTLSLELRPSLLDDLGLESALRWYLARQAERAGFAAELIADSLAAHLPPEIETACFRVAQEALTNVVRHAHASRVVVELRQRGSTLRLSIRDDGVGFDVQAAAHGANLGLVGMQERVLLVDGKLTIESAPGHGTTVRVRLPLVI